MSIEDVKLFFDGRKHKAHLVIRFSAKQRVNEMCRQYGWGELVGVGKAEKSFFP